jgi:hypothetical protein
MSREEVQEPVSAWITQWQSTGTPQWAIYRQTGQRVATMLKHWFKTYATVAEQLEMKRHGYSETFDAAVEVKFPGFGIRLEALTAEYKRLRSFDPATKEDLMVQGSHDIPAFQALCDLNISATATKGNEVFGAPVFVIPDVTETHEDLTYD